MRFGRVQWWRWALIGLVVGCWLAPWPVVKIYLFIPVWLGFILAMIVAGSYIWVPGERLVALDALWIGFGIWLVQKSFVASLVVLVLNALLFGWDQPE